MRGAGLDRADRDGLYCNAEGNGWLVSLKLEDRSSPSLDLMLSDLSRRMAGRGWAAEGIGLLGLLDGYCPVAETGVRLRGRVAVNKRGELVAEKSRSLSPTRDVDDLERDKFNGSVGSLGAGEGAVGNGDRRRGVGAGANIGGGVEVEKMAGEADLLEVCSSWRAMDATCFERRLSCKSNALLVVACSFGC